MGNRADATADKRGRESAARTHIDAAVTLFVKIIFATWLVSGVDPILNSRIDHARFMQGLPDTINQHNSVPSAASPQPALSAAII